MPSFLSADLADDEAPPLDRLLAEFAGELTPLTTVSKPALFLRTRLMLPGDNTG